MDFSELHAAQDAVWSPDGRMVLTKDKFRVVLRDAESLEIIRMVQCMDSVDALSWSHDSQYFLCPQYKRRVVQAWSATEEDWTCTIDEGLAGLAYACWAPSGRHILTVTDFQLRLTIWSLTSKQVHCIKFPNFTGKQSIAFSPDGRFLAVPERKNFKDVLGIYSTEDWNLLKQFSTATSSLKGVQWSPEGRYLAVYDGASEYNIAVYTPDGSKVARYQPYEDALGIKTVSWSPSGKFLAIGSFDEYARVFNNITWRTVAEYKHEPKLNKTSRAFVVYQEVAVDSKGEQLSPAQLEAESGTESKTPLSYSPSRYLIAQAPFSAPANKQVDIEAADPALGVGKCLWSEGDRLMATMNAKMPRVLYIWDMHSLALYSVLVQQSDIRSVAWNPVKLKLALCTGNNKLYLWSMDGVSIIDVPALKFNVRSVAWSSNGDSLILRDATRFCCCYIHNENSNYSLELSGDETQTVSSGSN
jgi:WD40 repeat protein